MNHEPFDTLAAVYAVGALDGHDLVEFEAHLAQGCERCTAALRETYESLAMLGRSAPPVVPPPEIKQALLHRMATATAPPARRQSPRPTRWIIGAAAAGIVASVLTGALVGRYYEARGERIVRELAAVRDRLQRQVTALNEEVTSYRSAARLLVEPGTQVVRLRGLGPSPGATARVIWHPAMGGELFVANLPPAPAGKAYELWTIGAGAPRPAGLFTVDAEGRAIHHVPTVESGEPVKIFAVTLEPEHGMPAPSGPMVLASAE
jgi:anti-sigma-K factor RskA